jgi:CDP-diacylglycerol---glycerol-3-phosphate 3-phosphatidyltransferase
MIQGRAADIHLRRHKTPAQVIMTEQLRKSFLGTTYYRVMQDYLLPPIQRSGLTPNQMTFVGVTLAFLVPFGFYLHPTLGLVFMATSGIADSMDGLLARREAKCSPFGAFLDSSLDRMSDFFYLIGFWTLFWHRPEQLVAALFIFSALLFTLSISYVKARAETLGIACDVGLMERGLRVVFLIGWALTLALFAELRTQLLWGGLLAYNALTLGTVLQRIQHVRKQLQAAAAICGRISSEPPQIRK